MENLKIIVKRSEWLRGEGHEKSFLLREEDGKRCCLGFAALALGHSDDELKGRDCPWKIKNYRDKSWPRLSKQWPDKDKLYFSLFDENDLEYDEIYSSSIEEFNKNKEEKIKILGQRLGFDFEFVD